MLSISYLNDFIFCPVSIYFHLLDHETEKLSYQREYQINGTAAHNAVDKANYSHKRAVLQAIAVISNYLKNIYEQDDLRQIMAYEGLSSRVYFKNHFNNLLWNGRQPRLKKDVVNSVPDMGYTLLFSFVDSVLLSYGFDTYKGVLHTQFYMRKSLTCDIVEPFRVLIDKQVKKGFNLKQIKEEDFLVLNGQYKLKWEKSPDYVRLLMQPLMENKERIFSYIQQYYRAFMKNDRIGNYPVFES